MSDRVGSAATPQAVVQAAADYYVKDRGDASAYVIARYADGSVFEAGAGRARKGDKAPPTDRTIYRLASLSKLLEQPVFLKLHREGRINLDSCVTNYATAKLPPEFGEVTLRDLLDNRSGLPREFLDWWDVPVILGSGFFGTDIYCQFETREAVARELWRPKWRAAVRRHEPQYSNVGFGLLGSLVEDATRQTLPELVESELAGRYGLVDTSYEPVGDQTNRLADACAGDLPYLYHKGWRVPDHRLGTGLRATGGLFSTPHDCLRVLGRYWELFDAYSKIRPLAEAKDADVYCLCRVKIFDDGRRVLYRLGMIYGGATFVGFDVDTRAVVLVFRNATDWPDEPQDFALLSRLSSFAPSAEKTKNR